MPLIQRFFNAPYGRCSFSTLAYELAMKTESRKKKDVGLELGLETEKRSLVWKTHPG